jgi:drug/metabolite transporter (DMT)-like permease
MHQGIGIWSAALSSALGGSAIAATRLLGDSLPPEMLGALRFGIAGLVLLPLALLLVRRRFARRDMLAVIALGALGFGIFPVIYNLAIGLTSASRAAMAICTMPLFTMLLAAGLGREVLTLRRCLGVLIAMAGVALALLGSLGVAPAGAWQGDLAMLGGALLISVFNVQSRGVIARVGVLSFTCAAMLSGALLLWLVVTLHSGFEPLRAASVATWGIVVYLGLFGGVGAMLLWSVALKLAPVTVVAVSVTISPLTAALAGALLLEEAVTLPMLAGLLAVGTGIWLTAARSRLPVA